MDTHSQLDPDLAVGAKRSLRVPEITFQHHRSAVIQGMPQRRRRMNPFQSMVRQGEG